MPLSLGLLGRLSLPLPLPLLLLLLAATAPGLSSAGNCCEETRNGEVVCLEKHFRDQNHPEMCHPCRSCGNNTEIRPCTNISDTVCAGDAGSGTEVGAADRDAVTGNPGNTGPTWDATLTDSLEQARSTNATPTEGSESGGWDSDLVLRILVSSVFLALVIAAVRWRAYLFDKVRCLWRLLRRFLDQVNPLAGAAKMVSDPPSRNTQDPATCPTPDLEEVISLNAHPPVDQPDTELVPCVPGCMEQE